MTQRTRIWLRSVGIGLVGLGVAGFVVFMLLLGRANEPIANASVGVLAGVGLALVLLSLPRVPGATGNETIRDLLSVFFTFGTLGPMIMAVITSGTANFVVGLMGIVVSGGLSVVWALAFIRRAFWMIPIAVVVSAFGPPYVFRALHEVGGFENFWELSVRARLGVLGVQSVVCLIVGYALMIRFVSRVERAAARYEAELDTAGRIHAQLVPPIDRGVGSWSVRARSLPSSTMGGDLVDLIERPDGGADLVLADVTGHGVRAGVVMALVKGIVWAELTRRAPLDQAVGRISGRLAALLDAGTFVTAAVVRLPAGAEEPAEIIVAGHPPVVIRRADGTTGRVGSHGLPWGIDGDERYGTATVALAPGDALVLYSDGITEAAPAGGSMLGIDGVDDVVAGSDRPDRAVEALLETAATHAGGVMDDDRSAAAVWRREPGV